MNAEADAEKGKRLKGSTDADAEKEIGLKKSEEAEAEKVVTSRVPRPLFRRRSCLSPYCCVKLDESMSRISV